MSKQKTPKGADGTHDTSADSRFTTFSTDPRFRLPSKKNARIKIDKRFTDTPKDVKLNNEAKVDRYGRKLVKKGKKGALERLYEREEGEEDSEQEDFEEISVEDDATVERELAKPDATYDPARGGGFSSSSEDEDSDDEEDDLDVDEEDTKFPDLQSDQAGVELGEVTSRIAIVNLDWDNIHATDLMAVFSSFVRSSGNVKRISIYKSEFGKERLAREEMEGPPKEIFRQSKENEAEEDDSQDSSDGDDSDSAEDEKIKNELLKEDDGASYDNAALRQYKLDQLRYYYAVMECSDKGTAQNIYEATDGTEYLSSANFFDLRFIPDETDFDDEPTEVCNNLPSDYKPHEFVTDALRQSKVKLTWDGEDEVRKEVIKKAFTGSRAEIGENDLKAYLGSDSESDQEEEEFQINEDPEEPKLSKKELARQKMRLALGLSAEPEKPSKTKGGPVGGLQVTFLPALSLAPKSSAFVNDLEKPETTAEAYVRKERERKARRREKAKAIRAGQDPDAEVDVEKDNGAAASDKEADGDLGFEDPFFTMDEAAKKASEKAARKEARKQKKQEFAAEAESNRAELDLIMTDNVDPLERLDHFDIKEIERAEKLKRKKGKKGKLRREIELAKSGGKRGGLQESFTMTEHDPRFGALREDSRFAVDPFDRSFDSKESHRKRRERDSVDGEEENVERSKKQKHRKLL